jgi:hypothetical protein
VLFVFSEAHLDDLQGSKTEFLDKDLNLIGHYTGDNYFYHDPIKNKTSCSLATPFEAFYRRDYKAINEFLDKPHLSDSILGLFSKSENSPVRKLIESILNMPIKFFSGKIDSENASSSESLKKLFPGYSPDMSLSDFYKEILPFGASLLKDENKVSELRKTIEGHVNRDDYSYEKWSMDFNERFRQTTYGKSFLEIIDSMLLESQKTDFKLRFSYAYTLLEMLSVTKERVGKKTKKNNVNSLRTDASHAYFGSLCDYLVSDDKGLQIKAQILYESFGIHTKILASKDLVSLSTILINQEETLDTFSRSLEYDLNKAILISQRFDSSMNAVVSIYRTGHSYFNLFNRLKRIESNPARYVLYFERHASANFIMFREIELIVEKLLKVLGVDDGNLGSFKFEENLSSNEPIRSWTSSNLKFELTVSGKRDGVLTNLHFSQLRPQK